MKLKWTIEITQLKTGSCTNDEVQCSFAQAQDAFFQSLNIDDIEFKVIKDTTVKFEPKQLKGN